MDGRGAKRHLGCFHDGEQAVLWKGQPTSSIHHATHQLTHLPPGLHISHNQSL